LLENRVAFVTGAGALAMATEGALVVVTDRESRAKSVAAR